MKKTSLIALPLALMLALGACSSSNQYAEVARFHTNQPINRGTLAIVPADPAVADSLEFRTHAETVAIEMRRLGFTTGLPADQVQYVATVDITQSDGQTVVRAGTSVGVPIGPIDVGLPVGRGPRVATNRATTLSVQIRRTSDNQMVWEGRATTEAAAGSADATLTAAVPRLAGALFQDFPGTPGATVNVRI